MAAPINQDFVRVRFYALSRFLFPRSFHLRLFSVCFLATHLPLLSFIGWQAAQGRFQLGETVLLLVATLLGTALAIGGLWALLQPITLAARTLGELERGRPVRMPPIQGEDLAAQLLMGVRRAASATAQRFSTLDEAAHRDLLTGLLNRRGLIGQLDAAQADEHSGVIALIDLDFFKQVNDSLGHLEGDRVLRDFAARIGSEIRKSDLLARWGGEEFAAYFPGATPDTARAILTRVARAMVSAPIGVTDDGPVTFSAGITRFRAEPLDSAIHRADAALYTAKEQGRNRIVSVD